MNFLLIRHADALPIEESAGMSDADRPLTDKGRSQCETLATMLKRGGVTLGTVVTSPYLRARQTADELLKNWTEPKPDLDVCEHLACGGKEKKLSRFLRTLETDSVTLIGHMPDLAIYTAWLIGSKKAQIGLAKAGVAFVESETGPQKGAGTLTWLLTPEWYR
jgi:phosphohistidine phosphatase